MLLTQGERKIMEVLWAEGPMTAKDLAARLWQTAQWRRTTAYTMVARCAQKGLLLRQEPDYLCIPCVSRDDIALAETDRLIDAEYGGSVDLLMTALIGQGRLSARQLRALYETLDRMEDES